MQFPALSQGGVSGDIAAGAIFQTRPLKWSLLVSFSEGLLLISSFVWPSSLSGPTELCRTCEQEAVGGNLGQPHSQTWHTLAGLPVGKIFLLLWASRCRFMTQIATLNNKKVAKNRLFLTWISSLFGLSAHVPAMGVEAERLVPAQREYKQPGTKWELALRQTSRLQCCWRPPTIKIHIQVSLLEEQ